MLGRRSFFLGASALAFAAALPTSPLNPVEQFIADMKAEGLWWKFDRIWVLASASPVNQATFISGSRA